MLSVRLFNKLPISIINLDLKGFKKNIYDCFYITHFIPYKDT